MQVKQKKSKAKLFRSVGIYLTDYTRVLKDKIDNGKGIAFTINEALEKHYKKGK